MADPAWTRLVVFVVVVLLIVAAVCIAADKIRSRWRARQHDPRSLRDQLESLGRLRRTIRAEGREREHAPGILGGTYTYTITPIARPGRTEARRRWSWDINDDLEAP